MPTSLPKLAIILALSFALNTCHASWGLPELWHPDEVTWRSANMLIDRTANPAFFKYPSLHLYLVAALGAPLHAFDRQTSIPTKPTASALLPQLTLYARILSALMGTAVILLTYHTALRLFDPTSALFSALILTLTAGFIGFSHFATVDIPLVFWTSLALLLCATALSTNSISAYAAGALTIGLSASTKYTGILLLFPIAAVYFANTPPPIRSNWAARLRNHRILVMISFTIAGFLLGTPFALISPLAFLKDLIQLALFQGTYSGVGDRGYWTHLVNLFEIFGPCWFVACASGFAFALYETIRRDRRFLPLIATITVLYAAMGSMMFSPARYILPVVPSLAICGGKLLAELTQFSNRHLITRIAWRTMVAASIAGSTVYSLAALDRMQTDARYRANDWITRNLSKDMTIEVSPNYSIGIPRGYSNATFLPYFHEKETFARMKTSPVYQRLSRIYTTLQSASAAGIDVPAPLNITEPPNVTLDALLERRPQVLVLAPDSYERFFSEEAHAKHYFPRQHELYSAILAGQTPYRLIADFRRPNDLFTPEIEFVDGGILIFEYRSVDSFSRESTQEQAPGSLH